MKKTHKVTVRIEEDLRDDAHDAVREMGISLSEYVYKQIQLLVKRKEFIDEHQKLLSEVVKIEESIALNEINGK